MPETGAAASSGERERGRRGFVAESKKRVAAQHGAGGGRSGFVAES